MASVQVTAVGLNLPLSYRVVLVGVWGSTTTCRRRRMTKKISKTRHLEGVLWPCGRAGGVSDSLLYSWVLSEEN